MSIREQVRRLLSDVRDRAVERQVLIDEDGGFETEPEMEQGDILAEIEELLEQVAGYVEDLR